MRHIRLVTTAVHAGRRPTTKTKVKDRTPVKTTTTSSKGSRRTNKPSAPKASAPAPASRPPPEKTNAQRVRNQRETSSTNHRAWQLQSGNGRSTPNPTATPSTSPQSAAASPKSRSFSGLRQAGGDLVRSVGNRLPAPVRNGLRSTSGAVRTAIHNPDQALDAVLKKPMMTERLTQAGDSQSFEVDVEVKGAVSVKNVGSAGIKGKAGGNLSIERRDDGDFDVSLKQSATLTKVGDRKKPAGTAGEQKLGWEGGVRVNVTETYTTSAATVEDRAADLVRDRIGDAYAISGGPTGRITNDLVDPSDADKAELADDWSKTKVEGGGFFRGQLSAKYGKAFGVETTIRDDWVQSGAVEVNKNGDVTLTLKVDNDISLKNGVFAKYKGVEGKLQELSDVEGSETTLSLKWDKAAQGRDALEVAQTVLDGDWQSPDSVRLRNRIQEHDIVERGGAKVTFDGTHAPYTETTTEVTFDTQGAQPHELAGLFKGDRAQANAFDPVAKQTVERFRYEGPDIDLKPEIKVPKAIKKVADLSVGLEIETGIRKRDALVERDLNPGEAVEQIRSNALDPLFDPLPSTLGGPNAALRVPGDLDVVDSLKTAGKVIIGGPIIAARKAGELLDGELGSPGQISEALTRTTFKTLGGAKWDRLSDAEKAYVTENPRLAVSFNHAADRADAVSVDRGFEKNQTDKGIYGDAGGNAYRHALWNGLMVRTAFNQDVRHGVSRAGKLSDASREAQAMADAHEDNPKNTDAINMQMDLRNNDIGRQVAVEVLGENRWASEADIASAIEEALTSGRLTSVAGGRLTTASDPR